MSKIFSNSNNENINNQKSRNRLVKSSSTGVNNLYEKYIDKIYLNKNNTRNKENDLRKYNSSASKVNNNKKIQLIVHLIHLIKKEIKLLKIMFIYILFLK